MPKKLLFTIGLPFSGKSTLAAQYAKQGWQVINRDDLLKDITESSEFTEVVNKELAIVKPTDPQEVFNIKNKIASTMLTAAVQTAVLNGESDNIFYDGTNLQLELRRGLLNLKNQGVGVEAVYLKVPVEEIIRRARQIYESGERREQFNEGALVNLQRMAQMFEEPHEDEGYDSFTVIEPNIEANKELKFN